MCCFRLSVVNALSMLYNGASGDTQREMAKRWLCRDDSGEVNRANADLKTSLENADPKVKLAIANFRQVRIFLQAGLPETQRTLRSRHPGL